MLDKWNKSWKRRKSFSGEGGGGRKAGESIKNRIFLENIMNLYLQLQPFFWFNVHTVDTNGDLNHKVNFFLSYKQNKYHP